MRRELTVNADGQPRTGPLHSVAAILLLRAATNGLFAFWLLIETPAWSDIFRIGAWYALVDGTLGLIAALLVTVYGSRRLRLLGALTFADALVRIAAAVVLRLLPGASEFPVTIVLLFGSIGTTAATVGAVSLLFSFVLRTHADGEPSRRIGLIPDPLAVAGVVAVVIGAILFVWPPATPERLRALAAGGSATLAVIFAAASLSSRPR